LHFTAFIQSQMSRRPREEDSLPAGWIVKKSKTHDGRAYYWNESRRESSWVKPSDITAASSTTTTITSPVQFGALHILIKHAGSRKPRSWKSDNITRTKEEAVEILKGHETTLRSLPQSDMKQKFIELASEHSDCPSAKKGGDLGLFERGKMQPTFEKAVEDTSVDELSGVVDTDSGVHLIYRTQ